IKHTPTNLTIDNLRMRAQKVAEFILENLKTPGGRLLHRFRDGEAVIAGNVEDYAFFILELMELYEATFLIRARKPE
ncbi:MAG: hypothetical protein ACFFDE_06945, partial [Promethearchaeota archaeon]